MHLGVARAGAVVRLAFMSRKAWGPCVADAGEAL